MSAYVVGLILLTVLVLAFHYCLRKAKQRKAREIKNVADLPPGSIVYILLIDEGGYIVASPVPPHAVSESEEETFFLHGINPNSVNVGEAYEVSLSVVGAA